MTRYLFQNTEFMGETFDYHATGKEKLLGFLKGMGIVAIFLIGVTFISRLIGGDRFSGLIQLLLIYTGIIFALPLITAGAHRFLLARTSYRNIRFNFSGDLSSNYQDLAKGLFLSFISCSS